MALAIATSLVGAGSVYLGIVTALVNFAISYIVNSFLAPDQPERPADQGVKQRIPTDTRNKLPIVYGEKEVAGTITFFDITGDNQDMAFIIPLCEGPVDSITSVKWEDKVITFNDSDLAGGLRNATNTINGDGQSDDFLNGMRFQCRVFPNGGRCAEMEAFETKWGVNGDRRTMPNVAYAFVRIKYDRDKRLTGLTARLKFNIKGKEIRTINSSGVLSTARTYSTNPAECLLDYLTDASYGAGVPDSAIDLASFLSHKNFCNETVTYTDNGGNSSTQTRYTANGVINTNQDIDKNVSDLTVGNSGSLTWNYGQFGVISDKVKSSTSSFSEDNIFGQLQISKLGFDNKLNQLTVKYDGVLSEGNEEQVIVLAPESVKNVNEPFLERTITLPLTSNNIEANLVAAIFLNQSRQDIVVNFQTSIAASGVESGDVISITHATPSWVSKKFLVHTVEERIVEGAVTLDITAHEYADEVYNPGTILEYDPAPNTNLPNPYVAPVISNLVATEDFTLQPANMVVTWDDTNPIYTDFYVLGYRESGTTDPFTFKTVSGGQRYEIVPLLFSTTYEVQVTPTSTLGNEGETLTDTTTTGIPRESGLSEITRFATFEEGSTPTTPTTSDGLETGVWFSEADLLPAPGYTHTSIRPGLVNTSGVSTQVESTFSGNGGGTFAATAKEIYTFTADSGITSNVINAGVNHSYQFGLSGDSGSTGTQVYVKLITANPANGAVETVNSTILLGTDLTTASDLADSFIEGFEADSTLNAAFSVSKDGSNLVTILADTKYNTRASSQTYVFIDPFAGVTVGNITFTRGFQPSMASSIIFGGEKGVAVPLGASLSGTSLVDDMATTLNADSNFGYTVTGTGLTRTFTSKLDENLDDLTVAGSNGGNNDTIVGDVNGKVSVSKTQDGSDGSTDQIAGSVASVLTITKSGGERNGSDTVTLISGSTVISQFSAIQTAAETLFLRVETVDGDTLRFTSIEQEIVTITLSIAAGTNVAGNASVSSTTTRTGIDPSITIQGDAWSTPVNTGRQV